MLGDVDDTSTCEAKSRQSSGVMIESADGEVDGAVDVDEADDREETRFIRLSSRSKSDASRTLLQGKMLGTASLFSRRTRGFPPTIDNVLFHQSLSNLQ